MADRRGATAPQANPGGRKERVLFGPKGHGAIAAIAVADLASRDAQLREKLDELLAQDPLGRADPFTAANWPDRIRGEQPETRPWHFIDIRWTAGAAVGDEPLPQEPHVVSQLEAKIGGFASAADDQERVDGICWIMHLCGDLHQPLHCITRVSEGSPEGDRGGNDFKLNGHWKNLHSLWDDSVNLLAEDSAEELASQIMQAHPRASLGAELGEKRTVAWARASHRLAIQHAYTLPDEEDAPPPPLHYLRNAMRVAQRQAAIGGYRLSNALATVLR